MLCLKCKLLKMKTLSLFTYPHTLSNPYDVMIQGTLQMTMIKIIFMTCGQHTEQ